MALPCGVTLTIDLLANACKCHIYAFACISGSGVPVMADLTLVSYDLCPYVQRAAIALSEKGVDFRRVDVDLSDKPEWFRAISPGTIPDRKSTRLNSSHQTTSYAAFCLKNKKKAGLKKRSPLNPMCE